MVEGARYAAFISYSHKDAAEARKLHGRLERYRIPKRLVGTAGDHGPVPARLTPIFRDRDELPAAGDLSETVRAALARSESLVVICSPHSAASEWVAREIAVFRELHPDRPVLAAVIAGEPGECFPKGLGGVDAKGTAIEPLAADLRKAGDGQRLGFLKLVAGLTGVGLDALVQRDAARAIRRVTAVTLTALAATLVMAVLTVIALNARQEAERQRAGAEGLVEFMLTDLRTKLKGVGRLEVLDIVNTRALDYYGDRKALYRLSDDSLERRARILHAMGEDQVALGDMDAALARFREAHAATEAILARKPNDPKAIFAHGQSDYWVGYVHEQRGEWAEAKQQYTAYAQSGERLIAIAPDNPDYMMERGWGPYNLGIVSYRGEKSPAEAETLFRDAASWFEKAERARPGDLYALQEMAKAQGWLGEIYLTRKLPAKSLEAYTKQYEVAARLSRLAPDDADRLFYLAITERSVGRLAKTNGDPVRGDALLRTSHARMVKLTAMDPANADWLVIRSKLECDLIATLPRQSPERTLYRRSIATAAATLEQQKNPKLAEIRPCLAPLS